MSHFQFDETLLHAEWCRQNGTFHTLNGDCSNQHRAFLPDIPPALLSGAPISAEKLEQILANPTYTDYGILLYRFPADSVQPEIQLIKRENTWMVLKFQAPIRYRPATRVLNANQVVRLIWTYIVGENVYPAEIEFIGTGPSQHRVWVSVH